jgi:hypothetical protein
MGEPEQSGCITGTHLQSAAAQDPNRASSRERCTPVFLFGLFRGEA